METPCTFATAADALKVYTENVINECAYTAKVSAAAAPDKTGRLRYSCYCGRTYTEQYTYSCDKATHIYVAKADGRYECTACGKVFESACGDSRFALTPAAASGGKADVILSVNAPAIAAAQINVAAPAGFTLTDADVSDVEGFYVRVSESDPCVLTLLSTTGANAAINTDLTLVYSVADTVAVGDYVFELTVPEFYDENAGALVATPVSAVVRVEPEEEIVYAAQIGDVKYATLADAFSAAQEGDAITALEKITVTGTEVWDLTGKTLVLATVEDGYALLIHGDLTIDGGNFAANTLRGIGVTGTLTINGGTFSTDKNQHLIGTWGTTTIHGGAFTAVYNNVNCFAGTLNITGGSFRVTGTDEEHPAYDVLEEESGTVTITGGIFSTDPTDYAAEGFKIEAADGQYRVVAEPTVVGDIDGDGNIALKDALTLLQSILCRQFLKNGDVNGDGKVSIADVIHILKGLAK